MKFKPLGKTGMMVSEICLGTMTWGSQNSESQAHEQMDYGFSQGVNFIDTAELYPTTPPGADTQGLTERYIGSWMKARANRDKVILATKVSGPGRSYIRGGAAIDGKQIRIALDQSLARLDTDYVDLYQLHWPNRGHYHFRQAWSYTPSRQPTRDYIRDNMLECLEVLNELVQAGKIRAIGLSNETAWGMMQFTSLAEAHGLPKVVSVQNEYNLLYRPHDLDHAEISHHEDIGLLAYSPLAAGLLSGKYLNGAKPSGSRASINGDLGGRFLAYQEPAVAAYVAIADQAGIDPSAMALAWCLSKPFMTSVIIGATTMEQLKTNIGAKDITLARDTLRAIQSAIRAYPMPI